MLAALFAVIVFCAEAIELRATNSTTPAARYVRIKGQEFVLGDTGASIVMGGPNVVVKGPPWLPFVSGDTICNDVVNSECQAAGNCTTC